MTTMELELAPIEQAAAPAAVTLAELAVRPLSALEPQLLALSERYRAVAFDLKTPKGMAAIKAARLDLRDNGRYAVQRARDDFKKQAEGAKKAVEVEADRLIALVKPREDELDGAIKAREAEIEAEKAEKARIERERVEALQAGVAKIHGYADRAIGQPAEKIAQAIAALAGMQFPEERWQEYAGRAAAARDDTVGKLNVLHTQALEAERLRAENAALQAAAAAAQAKLQAAADAGAMPVEQAQRVAEIVMKAAAQAAPAPAPVADPRPQLENWTMSRSRAPIVEPLQPSAPVERQTMNLGALSDRLGFAVTADFLARLGIHHTDTKGRAVLYDVAQWPAIKAALVKHIEGLA